LGAPGETGEGSKGQTKLKGEKKKKERGGKGLEENTNNKCGLTDRILRGA